MTVVREKKGLLIVIDNGELTLELFIISQLIVTGLFQCHNSHRQKSCDKSLQLKIRIFPSEVSREKTELKEE